jgi:hypothetical protein
MLTYLPTLSQYTLRMLVVQIWYKLKDELRKNGRGERVRRKK